MARKKTTNKKTGGKKLPIETSEHKDKKKVNRPAVGLAPPETDSGLVQKKTCAYDPHLDPQLNWAGKAEHTSFETPTISIHVHERIYPRTIIEAARKRNGNISPQMTIFGIREVNTPPRESVEFHRKHKRLAAKIVEDRGIESFKIMGVET